MHGLVVQMFSGVQNPCSRVEPELPQAEGIGAAQERVRQLVLLVSVLGNDLQDLGPCRFVFRDTYVVHLLRKLRPVVVGVDDTDKHLEEINKDIGFLLPGRACDQSL